MNIIAVTSLIIGFGVIGIIGFIIYGAQKTKKRLGEFGTVRSGGLIIICIIMLAFLFLSGMAVVNTAGQIH